ncbi:hypothetical protein SLEP1_g41033 [Rubroshorea leprosula]|uniref:Uncharacterized protein n=1 Tax=Rubroshorea leprosula TaxID=152421 RepID=A0AAV5L5S3_9ROSI|nr:hypothetical protein SLEP1_g41033 [Rubroshorea leprosula]
MEEEAINGIFSMKSDHVFKKLSGSDEACSKSWSLDNRLDDELSGLISGGGGSRGSWNITNGKKDDDDVEVGEEVVKEAEKRDEQTHYRWKQKWQNAKGDQISAMNDILINAEGSQNKLKANWDDKIQFHYTSNHERMIANSKIVPNSQVAQIILKKEGIG